MEPRNLEELRQQIIHLQQKHHLLDFEFDTECIYDVGDLSNLLQYIIDETLPEKHIQITEALSPDGKHFLASLINQDTTVTVVADTHTDWLPDQFFEDLENLPVAFGSDKRYYSINPAVGLTGQEAWYFCGTETQLKAARQEGLPLLFPGEDITETEEYRKYENFE